MPLYAYRCPHHGELEETFEMGKAPETVVCCSLIAQRVYGFYHQEDRRHMRSGISRATGQQYAQSRTEERAIEKSTGIEFMTQSEIPAHIHAAREYGEHLKAGKPALPPREAAALMSAPQEKSPTILEALRRSNVRLGEIPTDRLISGKPLPSFPQDVRPETMSFE